MISKFSRCGIAGIIGLLFLISGCGAVVKRGPEKEKNFLTAERLWEMHEDVNYVYFYYENGSVEKGLLLKWDGNKIKIQKRDRDLPEFIPAAGIKSIKVVVGNRIWESLAAGSALAAGYFFLVGAYDLAGESLGSVFIKMFGAPLIILTSIAYGSSSEKIEEYQVPENFKFNYEDARIIYGITE